jgi:hypothetical protein
MDPRKNPFNPGAGSQPPELTGRDAILESADIAISRVRNGRSAQGQILVGLRGVGKTVLLNRIYSMAEGQGAKAVLIEANEDRTLASMLLPPLRQILFSLDAMANTSEKVKRGLRVLRSFITGLKAKVGELELEFGSDMERGTADSGDLASDLGELFLAVAEAAQDRETAIVICIDELQYLSVKEFGALIMAIHKVTQRSLPMLLVGAGLPQILALAGKSKSYAERLFTYPSIGPLEREDALAALERPVENEGASFETAALELILKQTEGYPYFIQEWGKEAWNSAKGPMITAEEITRANESILQTLDKNFFRVRFDRLTPNEKRYLRGLASLGQGPQRSGSVADQLGVTTKSLGPIRDSLIKKGMIYSPTHGDAAFSVPLFGEFMMRVMPEATI